MRGRFIGVWSAFPLALALGALTVAGCAGGSSGSSTPVTEPTVNGTSVLAVANGSVPIPAAGGTSATFLTGPGAPANTIVTVTASTTAPANGVAPSALRRAAATGSTGPFYYVTFTVSASVPQSVFVSQVLTLAAAPGAVTFYEEVDDTTSSPGAKLLTSPAGVVSGSTVTFTPQWAAGSTFVPGHTYTAMFYDVPGTASPAPSGAPTTAPSGGATPTPAPTFTPTPPGSATPTPTPTPQPTTQSTAVTAGTPAMLNIPQVATISTGTVTLAFTGNTTVTLNSVPGLPPGVPSPTTNGVVFFAVAISASPAASVVSNGCGTGCTQIIPLTLTPTLNVKSAASNGTFYAAECSTTACPISPSDAVAEPIQGAAIVLSSSSFQDITGFSPTPTWFVFYYQ